MIYKVKLKDIILKAATKEKSEVCDALQEPEPDLSLDLKEHKLDYEIGALKQTLKEAEDTHKLRIDYSGKIFWLVCAWLLCVAGSVFMSGFEFFGFKLSDKVLITFISSTTVTVVGLFVVVAKWLFPNSRNS